MREFPYEKIQVSFFIQNNSDDFDDVTFIVKCQKMDFSISITKHGLVI